MRDTIIHQIIKDMFDSINNWETFSFNADFYKGRLLQAIASLHYLIAIDEPEFDSMIYMLSNDDLDGIEDKLWELDDCNFGET